MGRLFRDGGNIISITMEKPKGEIKVYSCVIQQHILHLTKLNDEKINVANPK